MIPLSAHQHLKKHIHNHTSRLRKLIEQIDVHTSSYILLIGPANIWGILHRKRDDPYDLTIETPDQ